VALDGQVRAVVRKLAPAERHDNQERPADACVDVDLRDAHALRRAHEDREGRGVEPRFECRARADGKLSLEMDRHDFFRLA
jgi:hypothetical protein